MSGARGDQHILDKWHMQWSAFNVSGVKTTKKQGGIRQEHRKWVLICNALHKITQIQATIMGIACIRRKQWSRKRFASKFVTPQTYPTRASYNQTCVTASEAPSFTMQKICELEFHEFSVARFDYQEASFCCNSHSCCLMFACLPRFTPTFGSL